MSPIRGGSDAAVLEVFSALADPTRLALLDRISALGGATATALATELPISRQAVVQHLAVLDVVGLIESQRVGRERRYEIRTARLAETARWIERRAEQWDARLAAIKRLAEAPR
jgi:DNA-binding transcriptional ArsR family regulator